MSSFKYPYTLDNVRDDVKEKDPESLKTIEHVINKLTLFGCKFVSGETKVKPSVRSFYNEYKIATLAAEEKGGAFIELPFQKLRRKVKGIYCKALDSEINYLETLKGFVYRKDNRPHFLLNKMMDDLDSVLDSLERITKIVSKDENVLYRPSQEAVKGEGARQRKNFKHVDFLERHRLNIEKGEKAELLVYTAEIKYLQDKGRGDLARKVKRVNLLYSLGYDILSYNIDESCKMIEVKAVTGDKSNFRFYLTKNEYKKSKTLEEYYLACVFNVQGEAPEIIQYYRPNYNSRKFTMEPDIYIVSHIM